MKCSPDKRCDAATQLCVDNVEPKITIDSPKAGAALTGKALTIKGSIIDDDNKVSSAQLTLDDGANWTAVIPAEDGTFAVDVHLPDLDSKPLTIMVRAKDPLDQEGTAQVTTTLDNVAPSCERLFEDERFIAIKDGPTFDVKFKVGDGSGAISRSFLLLNQDMEELALADGVATFAWTLPATADGERFSLTFHAEDSSGNACELESHLTVDRVPPKLTLSSPMSPALVGGPNQPDLMFSGSVESNDGEPATVTVDFDDGQGPRKAILGEPMAGMWMLYMPLPNEDYRSHNVLVRAVDKAGNESTATATVIVDRVAPVLAITSPTMNQKFNIASFAGGSDLVPITWTATDGDPKLTSEYRSGAGAWSPVTGTSVSIPTSASDNGTSYTVELRTADQAGNVANATVTFRVDRQAPKLANLSVVDNSRMNPRELSLTFSEPVTLQTSTLPLTPSDGTISGALTAFKISGLKGGTVYDFALPVNWAVDDFGNPNDATGSVKFHTEPAIPTSGTTIATGLYSSAPTDVSFEAASDEDGVVTVAWLTGTGTGIPTLNWGEFSPATGAFGPLAGFTGVSGAGTYLSLTTHRELNGLSAKRYRGYTIEWQAGRRTSKWLEDNNPIHYENPDTGALVLVPPGCADPSGEPVGTVSATGTYYRPSSTTTYSENSGLSKPIHVAPLSSDSWLIFGLGSSTAAIVERKCNYCFLPPPFGPSCGFGSVMSLTGTTNNIPLRWSVAHPGGGYALVLYDSGANRVQQCFRVCGGNCGPVVYPPPPPPPPVVTNWPVNEGLFVAPERIGSKVLGARMTPSGIELVEADLANGCPTALSSWTQLGYAPNTTSATAWRPVMFARKPGVIYQVGTDLKVWIR